MSNTPQSQRRIDRFIPEVALSHDGSIALAHWYIDRLADFGCARVKFQYHLAVLEPFQRWRTPDGRSPVPFTETRRVYLDRTALSADTWRALAQHAHARQMQIGSSVFCVEAVERLRDLAVLDFWKVPRTLALHTALAGRVGQASCQQRSPVFVSCFHADLIEAWKIWNSTGHVVRFLVCDGKEPTTVEDACQEMSGDGISYHLADPAPAIYHLTRDRCVEAHVQFVPGLQVPDAPWSLNQQQVAEIVEACR